MTTIKYKQSPEYYRQYWEKNREKINERMRRYRQERRKIITQNRLARMRLKISINQSVT